TAESLVGSGGDDVKTVIKWIARDSAGDEAGDMGHVGHGVRAHLFGDLYELGVIEFPAVGREAGQDYLRLFAKSHFSEFVIVDLAGIRVLHLVADEVEDLVDGSGRDR